MPANIRTYGPYLAKSIVAMHSGIDRANSINDLYYKEGSLILIANSWELVSKALLIKHGGELLIYETGSRKEKTITAEQAVQKLRNLGYFNPTQAALLQQIISLRNEATHQTLPTIPDEILFHLEYYAVRYYKELLDVNFKNYSKKFRKKFLSVSFESCLTFADSVKKLVARARKQKNPHDIRLVYLLERGVVFSGSEYIKQSDFDKTLLDKRAPRILYKLKVGEYARGADMIVVVPIQAPSGTQADIKLTKTISSSAISVKFDKHATDDDYPYLTTDLSAKLGVPRGKLLEMIKSNAIKGNPVFHQKVRTGNNSYSHKYSDQCLNYLREKSLVSE